MLSNKAALAAIGVVALVGASAAGTFLASRHAEPAPAPRPNGEPPGVEATEAVVDERSPRRATAGRRSRAGRSPRRPAPAAGRPSGGPRDPRRAGALASEPRRRRRRALALNRSRRPRRRQPRPSTIRSAWPAGRQTPEPAETVPVTDVPIARDDRRPVDRPRRCRRRRNSRTSPCPPTRSSACSWSRACRATRRGRGSRRGARHARRARQRPRGHPGRLARPRLGQRRRTRRQDAGARAPRRAVPHRDPRRWHGVAAADRDGVARGRVARQRERGQGRRRRDRRRDPRRDPRRRQGRGDWRRRRRRRRDRGRDGRRTPSPRRFRPARR